eukprot:Skav230623  [mRNA]  locus=scaffold1673:102886:104418:+ [translate_table: standard]
MPRDHRGKKLQKHQTPKNSKEADRAVLRAKLELARAERARADEKIRRLECRLFGPADHAEAETSDSAETSDGDASRKSQPPDQRDPPRQAGADMGERFLDMLLRGVGDGFPTSIRESAQEALRDGPQPDDDCEKGCNWIGGIRLAWTSPPVVREVNRHVQEHFPRPIQPGDPLDTIDGQSVAGFSRQEILGLLRRFKGSIGFKREGHDKAIRDSAKDALELGPQHDAEYSEGQNWIWGFLFAWTSPPVVRDVKPEMQQHFPNPINPGDLLHEIDGNCVSSLDREAILKLLSEYKGDIGFRSGQGADFHRSALQALQSGPEEDPQSGKGCNWIGGILLAWTSPPVVRDVRPEVQKYFPQTISPGDVLRKIDGKHVKNLNREEILHLLQNFDGSIGFGRNSDMDDDVRKSAQDALQSGPQEDESGKGCDWIGGILLAWTSPPVVRDVRPEVQRHFRRPISPGDVLHSVSGEEVQHLSRDEILGALLHFDGGLSFRPRQATEIADLLRRLGNP